MKIASALCLTLLLAVAALGQTTIGLGLLADHGPETAWVAPWEEGSEDGLVATADVAINDWGNVAAFVATDGSVGVGPRVEPPFTYWRLQPFVDAMAVNRHYDPLATTTWESRVGVGVDIDLSDGFALRYHWSRGVGNDDGDGSISVISVTLRQ